MNDVVEPKNSRGERRMNHGTDSREAYWAIGCARTPSEVLPYYVTWRDIDIDIHWARAILPELGVTKGSLVHFTHNYSESAMFWPYYQATRHLGAAFANGMASPYDAYRLEMYLRRFHFQACIGVTGKVLEGIAQARHHLDQVFARVPVIAAFPGAHRRLEEIGFKPWRLLPLGPLFAIEAPDKSGARYNHGEWILASKNGRIFLSASPKRRRDNGFVDLDTGLDGAIEMVSTPRGREPRLFTA
ncbi:MAG: hypothetical protein LBE62_08475 [Azonexus sp.]|jgi:hypothetical protein|nr:hypothetical protein [Azonexus sp.]